MAQRVSKKNSKRKVGLSAPGYTPKLHKESTEEAKIPLWQPDGTVRYISEIDFKWLKDNGKIDA